MSEELKCPICGKPTNVYFGNARKDRLCLEHGKMANNGEIEQCPDCGKWHKTDENCECKKTQNKNKKVYYFDPTEEEIEKNNSEELTCIICGKPRKPEYHFCSDCWKKYHSKTVYIKIKNCKTGEPLGTEYESDLVCEDGHVVKSEPERAIDDWLFRNGIWHIYEKPYPIDDIPEHDLHPDWCLPNYITDEKGNNTDVYIEYWGIEGSAKYDKIKNYKMPIYEKDKITLININGEQDRKNISATLERKIKRKQEIKPNKIQ